MNDDRNPTLPPRAALKALRPTQEIRHRISYAAMDRIVRKIAREQLETEQERAFWSRLFSTVGGKIPEVLRLARRDDDDDEEISLDDGEIFCDPDPYRIGILRKAGLLPKSGR